MLGMGDLLEQAKLMQSKMSTMQEELAKKTVEGSSGGGMVRVVANGKMEILSTVIEKSMIDANEAEMLQDLVTAAANDALRQARALAEEEMASITGGLKIPGLG